MSDNLTAVQVITDSTCRKFYPGISQRHELIYPGRLVPLWAIEVVSAFQAINHVAYAKVLNRVLKRIPDDRLRAELVRSCLALVSLQPDSDLLGRCTDMVDAFLLEHGFGDLPTDRELCAFDDETPGRESGSDDLDDDDLDDDDLDEEA